jgi:uncharacterized Zn finger protein
MVRFEEEDGYCPNCGMSNIRVVREDNGDIRDICCNICGYAGIGIEIYSRGGVTKPYY